MIITGVAVLAGCFLVGMLVGEFLGLLMGVDANVGGVGFAMVLLVLVTHRMRRAGMLPSATEQGVFFWSAMYIPIVVAMAATQNVVSVVAMAATQNVVSAVAGGPMALLVGLAALVAGAALVPVLARIGGQAEPLPPLGREPEMEEVA
ncbi:malonate transporter subunit MadL [Kocuria sp. NPDC057446]|uniref:malonate transporter subunit MadL n=1 Tax=Kocuria sp. NPDC057446 TaxID=3346137 RepID=UPI00367C30A5